MAKLNWYGAFNPTDTILYEQQWEESYDGSGCALAKRGSKYIIAEYSHCSCDGPEETMHTSEHDTLEDALRHFSQWAREYVQKALEESKNELGEVRL